MENNSVMKKSRLVREKNHRKISLKAKSCKVLATLMLAGLAFTSMSGFTYADELEQSVDDSTIKIESVQPEELDSNVDIIELTADDAALEELNVEAEEELNAETEKELNVEAEEELNVEAEEKLNAEESIIKEIENSEDLKAVQETNNSVFEETTVPKTIEETEEMQTFDVNEEKALDLLASNENAPLDIISWIPGNADENGTIKIAGNTGYTIITLKDGRTIIWTAEGPNDDTFGNKTQKEFLENLKNSIVKDPNFQIGDNVQFIDDGFIDENGNIIIKTPKLDENGRPIQMYPRVDSNGNVVLDENGNLIYDNPNSVPYYDAINLYDEVIIGQRTIDSETGEMNWNLNDNCNSLISGEYTGKEYIDPDTVDPIKPIKPEIPEPNIPEPNIPEPNIPEQDIPVDNPTPAEYTGTLAKTGDNLNIVALVAAAAGTAALMGSRKVLSKRKKF